MPWGGMTQETTGILRAAYNAGVMGSLEVQAGITCRASAMGQCEREQVAERSRMCEGDCPLARQPVNGGKDLGPGIVPQQGDELIQRTGSI